MSQRTNIEAQRSRTGNGTRCASVKSTSLYVTKAFGCLVWGETFYSVVSLYVDHQHGLLRSSKAHKCKLLHIKKKTKKKAKRPWLPSQTAERQATTSMAAFDRVSCDLCFWPVAMKTKMCMLKGGPWLSSVVSTYVSGVTKAIARGNIALGPETTTDQSGAPLIGF